MTKGQRARGKKYERLINVLDREYTRLFDVASRLNRAEEYVDVTHASYGLLDAKNAISRAKEALKRCGEDK